MDYMIPLAVVATATLAAVAYAYSRRQNDDVYTIDMNEWRDAVAEAEGVIALQAVKKPAKKAARKVAKKAVKRVIKRTKRVAKKASK